jgi:hypothetical protein
VGIVNTNKPFYDDFVAYLQSVGYADVHMFIRETSDSKAVKAIIGYLLRESPHRLYDGLARPYTDLKRARWVFLAWMFRDAPTQRLQPLLAQIAGRSSEERRDDLLNELRKFVTPLFPMKEQWEWPVVSETMLARLEGSRRAGKGKLFESIVRLALRELFEAEGIRLNIPEKEIKLNEETYDVQVIGPKGTILIPVKTRETMGGGHALLFTRDIHKSITVAYENGFECIPVVIAESWGGNLEALPSKHHVYIKANPNQAADIAPALAKALKDLLPAFRLIE